MFYFIPAWKNLQVSKIDETLSQIKMFYSANEEYRLWVAGYMPNLRTTLFLEGLSETKYSSIFDEMQNICQNYENKINLYDLHWPEDASFVYSQFAIFVLSGNTHYANVYFDSLNNIKNIDVFDKEQQIINKIIFDDRGFVSSKEFFECGVIYKKEFFDQLNQLQFVVDYTNGEKVVLGEDNRKKYGRQTFDSLNEFVKYIFDLHFKTLSKKDTVVIAIEDELLEQIKIQATPVYKLVSSVFSNRKINFHSSEFRSVCSQSSLILVDCAQMVEDLASLQIQVPLQALTPYDAILKLGESQQVGYYRIHYVYGGESEKESQQMLNFVIQCYQKFGWHFRIHCLKERQVSQLNDALQHLLHYMFDVDLITIQEMMQSTSQKTENKDVEEISNPDYFAKIELIRQIIQAITFKFFVSKDDLLASLLHTRLIIDLGRTPNVLTQICGISTGIPMINCVDTSYVLHQKNGWIVKDKSEILTAMHYYLDGLKHWNEALVYSVEQLKKYTDGAIIKQWKEWLNLE